MTMQQSAVKWHDDVLNLAPAQLIQHSHNPSGSISQECFINRTTAGWIIGWFEDSKDS